MTLISCTLHLTRTKPAVLRQCTEMGGEVCLSGVGGGGADVSAGGGQGAPLHVLALPSHSISDTLPLSAVTDASFLHLFPAR